MKRYFNTNRDPYYKYMLCYVDDLLHIGFKPKEDMDSLNMIYWLEEGFGLPDQYLGANVENIQLKYGRVVCSTNCVDYLKNAIENVDNSFGVDKTALNNDGDGHSPYPYRFRPESDVTEELHKCIKSLYALVCGLLRWLIEIGRIDILTEASCLYQHWCSPR